MRAVVRFWLVSFLAVVSTGPASRSFAQADEAPGRRVLIGFTSGGDLQAAGERAETVRQAGGVVLAAFELVPVVSAWMPEGAISVLTNWPDVTYVEDDVVLQAFEQSTSWGVDRIDADLVWPAGNTGVGVDVAILDTGIDAQHPDLAVVDGVDFADLPPKDGSKDPADWKDGHGHGTHCAGIVAALDNEIGVVGVAPGARLHAVKVLADTGFGYTSDIIQGLEWCALNHMHVASMSLGGGGTKSLEEACDQAFAAGVLIVAAAGNSRGAVSAPAAYSSVMAVSATDAQDNLAYFSNFGPEIELAAPGVNIYSTYKGGSYTYLSGTSMACPHVTGTAALVWASGALSNVAVRDTLNRTAEDLGAAGWDAKFGYGLVDARKAATMPVVQITYPAEGTTVSGTITLEATARGGNDIASVEFLVDATSIGSDADGADGWSLAWDTTGTTNGAHQVTAVAADSLGQTTRHSIEVVVDNAADVRPGTAMHVSAMDMWVTTVTRGYLIYTKVAISDDSSPAPRPVSGATVSATITPPTGRSIVRSAVTGPDGTATLSVRSSRSGTCTSTVTNVVHPTLTYEPAGNLETTKSCPVP